MKDLERLVKQAQNGDRQAYDALVSQFRDVSIGYAYSLLGDFHLAEDATQEACLGAYLDLGKLLALAAFPGWFRQIVFMRCSRLRRERRKWYLKMISLDELPDLTSETLDPASAYEQQQLKETIHNAIEDLPEEQRLVTRLFYFSDYSQKEIAVFLKIPLTTVKKRLQYARNRLKERITPVPFDRRKRDMDIQVVLSDQANAYIVKNLYPLYLHDLSEFADWKEQVPNEHGILEPDNPAVRTLVEHGEIFKGWWEKPGVLFPYLILVDGRPAGFIFIATHPHVVMDTDYIVHEFFLLHPYRGKGIGQQVAAEVFDKFHSRWDVYVSLKDLRSQKFWHKTISAYTSNRFEDFEGPTPFGSGNWRIFRFINGNQRKNDPHLAAYRGDVEELRRHLSKGIHVDARSDYARQGTLLHWAAVAGRPEVVDLLIANRASLESLDSRNRTPLLWALHGEWLGYPPGDRVSVVRKLLEAGAQPHAAALKKAEDYDMTEMIELLLEFGAKT